MTTVNVAILVANAGLLLGSTFHDDRPPVRASRRNVPDDSLAHATPEGSIRAEPARNPETAPATAMEWAAKDSPLTDRQLARVALEVYRTERLWRRTRSLLRGLERLEREGTIGRLPASTKEAIVRIARAYVAERAELERSVMLSEYSELASMKQDLAAFDSSNAARIERELSALLDGAVADRVARIIVPGRP